MSLTVGCTHKYGQVVALDAVHLDLQPGVTGLVGVNGAGKSTLLRILAGVMKPSAGAASVAGCSLYGPDRQRALGRVGFMPQSFNAPSSSRVEDVLEYVGWLRGLTMGESRTASTVALATVDLADRAGARISSLSGGMMRRLAFAQSVLADPDVLLLDEPTTGLDPEQRAKLRNTIANYSSATVTVISSHLIEDISTLANHLIVLEGGRVVFNDDMEAFRRTSEGSDEERFLRILARERSK